MCLPPFGRYVTAPMHCFASRIDLLVFALWPNRLHYVNELAMTEELKLAGVTLLGSVETLSKLHEHTLGMGIAGVILWQHEPSMLDCSCTPASDTESKPASTTQQQLLSVMLA